MKNGSNIGIIIQARFSSTRLQGKLFLQFYRSKKMIEVFLEEIVTQVNSRYKIVLATSTNKNDDIFANVIDDFGIDIFRGDEYDVLKRIINAADQFGFSTVIRVCADNPVYDISSTLKLIDFHKDNGADYTSFCLEGELPSIKSHLGLWGEVIELNALRKVAVMTDEKVYHEHVTNFIYANPHIFNVNLIHAPEVLYTRTDIRLTVDQIEDFTLMQNIYSELKRLNIEFTIDELVKLIEGKSNYLEKMKKQIERNKK